MFTRVALVNEMKFFTVLDHVRLCRLRRLDAVGRGGAGCGRWRLIVDQTDAGIRVCPQTRAVGADLGVPSGKLLLGNVVVRGDLVACVAFGDEMKLVAVLDHLWLRRLRRLHAIGRSGRSRGGSGSGSRVLNDSHARIGVCDEADAVHSDLGVPSGKLLLRDGVVGRDLAARVALVDVVEAVAVADHVALCRLWRLHTVAIARGRRRRRRQRCRGGRGCARGRRGGRAAVQAV